MTIVLNGTTGITNDGGYTGDGVVFADTTPANTLVTTTGGDVGIGTSSPTAKLDVAGATRTYSRAANGGPNNTTGNNIWWYIGSIRLGDSESATLRMDGTQSYGAGAGIAGCTYLHLRGDNGNGISGYFYGTSSGEFGIQSIAYKATAISEQFDLWVRIAEFASAVVYCDTNGVYAPASTGTGSATQPSGSTLFTSVWTFTTGGVERARIDSSGNLLVGTASATARFVVRKSSGDGVWMMQGYTDGTEQLRINNSGNIQNALSSYGELSDIKLKENIVDAPPKLEKLNQVRIVNFNLIGSEQKQIGVIAQELEQIFPGMVEDTPDRDEEGNDLGTTTKGVKYSVFVPMLIKAIQEQQAIILAQESALNALTARVAALEGK